MSDVIGNMYLGSDHEIFIGKTYGQHSDVSETMSGVVDEEIKKIIDEMYKRALGILENHREIMEKMVTLLYEKETIFKEEVDALFEGASVESILSKGEAKPLGIEIVAEPTVEESVDAGGDVPSAEEKQGEEKPSDEE